MIQYDLDQIGDKVWFHKTIDDIHLMQDRIVMKQKSLKVFEYDGDSELFEVECELDIWNGEYKRMITPNGIIDGYFEKKGFKMCEGVHFEGEYVQIEDLFEHNTHCRGQGD